jgi:hypothetical protein
VLVREELAVEAEGARRFPVLRAEIDAVRETAIRDQRRCCIDAFSRPHFAPNHRAWVHPNEQGRLCGASVEDEPPWKE